MPQKLELTWYGKDEPMQIEPRLLIENAELSNCKPKSKTENMLIHGDNLLALKALESQYAGKVKCIYIDPPFNTGAAFANYDDNIQHSVWLSLMYERLKLLNELLTDDGSIFVHIDYNEEAYLRILLDETFGRDNYRDTIIVSRVKKNVREREKVKALNFSYDMILFYAKSDSTYIIPPVKESIKKERWHGFDAQGYRNGMDYELFGHKPSKVNHWRWTYENAIEAIENYKIWERDFSDKCSLTEYWIQTGQRIRFLRSNPKTKKPEYFIPASNFEIMDTNWLDLQASSFSWNFPNGEKNEQLIRRIFEMTTNPGDLILDSFLGSGTTAAVAHKMGRRWIGIEMGDHAYSHCKVRLDKVISGEDNGGISKDVQWQGGGEYRFFELAPSLINYDLMDQPIFNREYNAEMLAAAVALHEGYKYQPDDKVFWKQSVSNEKSWLFVTTRHVTVDFLSTIVPTMNEGEYLFVAARSFDAQAERAFKQITVKKIPDMLLKRCKFGKKDYNLNIIHPPVYEDEDEE